jgi:hypothetical protein
VDLLKVAGDQELRRKGVPARKTSDGGDRSADRGSGRQVEIQAIGPEQLGIPGEQQDPDREGGSDTHAERIITGR